MQFRVACVACVSVQGRCLSSGSQQLSSGSQHVRNSQFRVGLTTHGLQVFLRLLSSLPPFHCTGQHHLADTRASTTLPMHGPAPPDAQASKAQASKTPPARPDRPAAQQCPGEVRASNTLPTCRPAMAPPGGQHYVLLAIAAEQHSCACARDTRCPYTNPLFVHTRGVQRQRGEWCQHNCVLITE